MIEIYMNILFLNIGPANPLIGGVQAVSYSLYKYFKERGHRVIMLSWTGSGKTGTDFTRLPNPEKILSHDNKNAIDNIIKTYDIDIVMNHTCLNPVYAEAVKYIKIKFNIPIVSVYHNSPFGIFGIRKYPRLAAIKNRTIYNIIDATIKRLFVIKYHRRLSMLAAYSDKVAMLSDCFIPEFLFFARKKHAPKMMSMPNPLKFSIPEHKPTNKENIVLFVGRLSKEKGLNLLIDIWARIENRFPDWRLLIVGDGPERESTEERIKKYDLKQVEMLGFKSPEPYYAKAKIFCMTSIFEGFGLVLIEAMAYGVVPLAFNSYANLADIITDGRTGFVIPPFNVDYYANKVAELINDPQQCRRLSENAYRESFNYELERISSEWEHLFLQLIT